MNLEKRVIMHIVWKYIRPLRWWVALALLLAGLTATLSLVDPLIFGKIIDQYVNPDNKPSSAAYSGSFVVAPSGDGLCLGSQAGKDVPGLCLDARRTKVRNAGFQ